MSSYIAKKTIKLLINSDKKIKGSEILVLGLTFKENCPDIRNTKVVDIIDDLLDFKCKVDLYDPWINKEEVQGSGIIDISPCKKWIEISM